MTRVFCAALATETNTFGPLPTQRQDFEDWFLYTAGTHPSEPTLFTAPLTLARDQAEDRGWTVLEGLCAAAFPSGRTVRADYESLRDELLSDLVAALPVNIVLMGLHGAMAADGYDDCEGDLLVRIREIVGPNCVIGGELDPHCHLTDQMLASADVLLAYHEYPHTDSEERAARLLDICHEIHREKIKPVTTVMDLRMSAQFFTKAEPSLAFVDMMRAIEKDGQVLAASLGHSFASGDVADMGVKIWITNDADSTNPEQREALVRGLGDAIWNIREMVNPDRFTIKRAIDKLRQRCGLSLLAEGADNPGGGAPGDATELAGAIINAEVGPVAIGPIWDPIAVQVCAARGVGAVFPLRFGGKASALSGDPFDLTVEVLKVSHDVVQNFGGNPWPLGTVVGLRAGDADFALCSLRNQALTLELFEAAGIDAASKQALVLKSNHHFSEAFGPLADQILYMDTQGAAVVNPLNAPYQNITRPLWPLDSADAARSAHSVRSYT